MDGVLGPSLPGQWPLPPELLWQAAGSSRAPEGLGRLCGVSGISFRQFSRPWRGLAPEAASVFTAGKGNRTFTLSPVPTHNRKQPIQVSGLKGFRARNLEVWGFLPIVQI